MLLNYSCGKKENFADDNTEAKCKTCRLGYISGMQCFKNQAPLMKKFGQLSAFFDDGVRKYLCNKYGDKFEKAYKNGINSN